MKLLSSPRAALLASLLVAFSGLRADAHAPLAPAIKILPAHHATLAFRNLVGKPTLQSASFNKLTTELLYNRVPGYSGATSALFAQTKAASGSGILNGIYSKINSGQVGSGQLNGTFYQQSLGSNSSTTFQNT